MRKIDDGAWISESGELWIEEDGKLDSFAPPDAQPPRVKRATGFTYLDVPTYGLLGMFWKNNPLQFASEATAKEMAKVVEAIMPGATVWPYKQEVRVGPFSWSNKYMLLVMLPPNSADLNAGEMAATMSRHPQTFAKAIREQIEIEFSKRPQGEV